MGRPASFASWKGGESKRAATAGVVGTASAAFARRPPLPAPPPPGFALERADPEAAVDLRKSAKITLSPQVTESPAAAPAPSRRSLVLMVMLSPNELLTANMAGVGY